MRIVDVKRETNETKIVLNLNPDGAGKVTVESGVPFFDHMLTAMAKHGGFDLTCTAKGDLHVDCHHTIEDIGIVLGEAVKQVMGEGGVYNGLPMRSSRWMNPLPPWYWTAAGEDTLSSPARSVTELSGPYPRIFSSISSTPCATVPA